MQDSFGKCDILENKNEKKGRIVSTLPTHSFDKKIVTIQHLLCKSKQLLIQKTIPIYNAW